MCNKLSDRGLLYQYVILVSEYDGMRVTDPVYTIGVRM